MNRVTRFVGKVLDIMAPPPMAQPFLAFAEASREAWEAGELEDCRECFPDGWVDAIHDYCELCDDDTDSAPRPAGAAPADTNPPLVSAGTLVSLIAQTLRDNDVRPYLIPAQLVAQAIRINYRVTPR